MQKRQGVSTPPDRSGDSGQRRRDGYIYIGLLAGLLVVGFVAMNLGEQEQSGEVIAVTAADTAVAPSSTSPSSVVAPSTSTSVLTSTTSSTLPATTSTTTSTTSTIPLANRSLERIDSVFGNIAPKSVAATSNGLFFAQNMMYRHTVTVYDEFGSLLRTIDDRVDLAEYGFPDRGVAQGAPVEAASTSDGSYVYVSNYAMYGPGFGPEPDDSCTNSGWDNSFVYRVDANTLDIDQVIEVGAVPKFLAVSPDDQYVVVSNWCSYDVSIIDTTYGREIARVDIGRHPRGVAISSDSSTAYVTEMGGTDIAVIPLDEIGRPDTAIIPPNSIDAVIGDWNLDFEIDWIEDVGNGPRSVVLSPDDQWLYATLNGDGKVVKIDADTGEVVESVRTGDAPRSMAMSGDGSVLYIVNYFSDSLSKVVTDSFEEVQEIPTADKPIGITVDPLRATVWVSSYSGVLQIFEDQVVE